MDLFPSLREGINKLKSNPQLWYTIFVALMILFAFIFVADRFVTIAQDAQNRLVDTRIGALQDSFVEFAPNYFDGTLEIEELNTKIKGIAFLNQTIRDFKVVRFENSQPKIIASLNNSEIGEIDQENIILYNIAKTEPNSSFTNEVFENNGRFFKTIRSITDNTGNPVGAVLTIQSLSEADVVVSENIQNSVIVFIVIVILIMFLFFRHARIIDYTALYRKLKEVDNLKDDFISMASHELRTPLTVIRGYAENLRDAGPTNEMQEKSISRIDIAAKQLDDLVNDMLDVSRIEQGRMKIESAEINPIGIIGEVVEGLIPIANEKGLSLSFTHALQTNEKINIDPARFKQVMTNLVGNAVKYTKKGEVKVKTELKGDRIEIRVSDTGIGMSADDQEKLFEKFYRIKNEKTADVRGTGLGLWITKQIVENMGGKISVESIEGVGTHFIVSFRKVG